MAGKFYATTITTTGANEDILDGIRTTLAALSISLLNFKTLTLSSENNIGVDIDNVGAYSTFFADASSRYNLSLKEGEVIGSSVKIETSGHVVWIGIVF